jgi:hypothetical protein
MAKKKQADGSEVEADETQNPANEAAEGAAPEDEKGAEPVEESTEGFVKMHKHGEYLHVHPSTVRSHEQVGWKVA